MLDEFELFERIGAGTLGTLYRGHDTRMDCEVAVKVIHPELAEALAGAESWWKAQNALVRHTTLRRDTVRVHLADRERSRIVTDFLPGSLATRRSVEPEVLVGVLKQVLKALDALHSRCGLLHLAIHPENLRLDEEGFVLLGDARGVEPGAAGAELLPLLAGEGDLLGPALDPAVRDRPRTRYLAPELLDRRFGLVHFATDLYALGMTALELLAGEHLTRCFPGMAQRPVDPANAWAHWHRDASREVLPIQDVFPDVPDDLARVLAGLTAKSVSARYANAREALEDLKEYKRIVPVGHPVSDPIPVAAVEVAHSATATASASTPAVRSASSMGQGVARPRVRTVGGRVPARAPEAPPKTLVEHAGDAARWGQAHWRRSPVTRLAGVVLVFAAMAFLLLPGRASTEATTEFLLENEGVSARMTLYQIPAAQAPGETPAPVVVLNGVPLERARPWRKVLAAGVYRVRLAAENHEDLDETFDVGTQRQFTFSLPRRWVRVRLASLEPAPGPVRYRHKSKEGPLPELKLPVGETSEVDLRLDGYKNAKISIKVPRDADDQFIDDQAIALTRLPSADRLVVVRTVPEDATVTVGDLRRNGAGGFRLRHGTHTIRVSREGFRDQEQTVNLTPADQPLILNVQLQRPSRQVRFEADPDVQIRFKNVPTGTPDRALSAGEALTFETGTVLSVEASVEGLALGWEATEVTVEEGEGAQVVALRPKRPERLKFPGVPFTFIGQSGGLFHPGFERPVYLQVVRRKLGVGAPGMKGSVPPPPLERVAAEASGVVLSRQQFDREHPHRSAAGVLLPPFYAAESPVTWSYWNKVMGTRGMPAAAIRDVNKFLATSGELPATNLPKMLCQEFRFHEEQRLRREGALDDGHTLALPLRDEMDYLIKGGLSDADLADPTIESADLEWRREKSLVDRAEVWLNLEANCRSAPGPVAPRTIRANRLGVSLGNVASWVHDGGTFRGGLILGPSFQTRPNRPALQVWARGPLNHDFPERSAYILHDRDGFWPDQVTYAPVDQPPGTHVGFYLVIRRKTPRPATMADQAQLDRAPAGPLVR